MTTEPPYPAAFERYEADREKLTEWMAKNYLPLLPPPRTEAGERRKLVDVAAGEGFWADLFQEAGFDVYAFDFQREYVDAGKRKYPQVEFAVRDALEPPPEARHATFDVTFCRTIPYLYAEWLDGAERLFENLFRWTKPGGTILISAYTTQDGRLHDGCYGGSYRHHTAAALESVLRTASKTPLTLRVPVAVERHVVGNYVQLVVRTPEGRQPL